MENRKTPGIFRYLLIAWAAVVAVGALSMARYATTPAPVSAPGINQRLPQSITTGSDRLTLAMFIHPKCPCSSASIDQLAQLLEHGNARVHAFVFVFQPGDEPDEWSHTALVQKASQIPGVQIRFDKDAGIARACGAQASGDVQLYDQAGHLIFEGGITSSRGHAGDNDYFETLHRLIFAPLPSEVKTIHTPIFGCAIYSSTDGPSSNPSALEKK